jgi:cytochrome c-type biogenesis protein
MALALIFGAQSISINPYMEQLSLLGALVAGLLSFSSPCVLPMVPVYLGSICGPEILEPGAERKRLPLFFHTLSFVIGFSLVFVSMGAVAGLAGFALGYHIPLRWIGGGLLIVFGLFLLASLKVPWLNYERRLTPALGTTTGYLRSLFIGIIFSLAWAPCIVGLLGGTISLALASGSAWRGAALLAVYSLGLGLPFLVIGAAFESIRPLLRRIQRYSTWIYIISGLLLIAVGVLMLTGSLVWLQGGI